MRRHSKWFWLRALAMVLLAWSLAGGQSNAASAKERHDWDTFCKQFTDATGQDMWGIVEENFASFIQNYPASEHYANAVVLEAQAKFAQRKFDEVISLLSAQESHAGAAADQFAYWKARAYLEQKNFDAAGEAFARLVRENTNSPLRLEAVFREADAHAKLAQWQRVIEELQNSDGVFRQIARTNATNDLVARGFLLLAEAQLAQTNYTGAEATLSSLPAQALQPDLQWDRLALLCRAQLDGGHPETALQTTTNLMAVASTAELRAKTFTLRGQIFEALPDVPKAIQNYETNLSSDLPEQRREALLRIVELTLQQNQVESAAKKLNDFLINHPEEKNTDLERLMLGELRLREYFQPPPGETATNLLQQAESEFQKLASTNGNYRGKAELNLGWSFWMEGKLADSQTAFGNAINHLPFSEDQAMAQFKLADILLRQTNYAGAVAQYEAVITKYAPLAGVKNDLMEQALYQIVRAGLNETNLDVATNAMGKILEWFPNSLMGEHSMLLVGQAQNPADARMVLSNFRERFPDSTLLPEVRLAIARTFEKEQNWADAIKQYNLWVDAYTNHPALPRAEFARAWANYKGGIESNAFGLFTNFVARFQTNGVAHSNDLPARAQYWVADFYWHQEPQEFQKAEISYQEVFTKWPESPLAFEARMMAGRAAIGRQDPRAAIAYFTSLYSNTNCPAELAAQALFFSGDAILLAEPTNYPDAIRNFRFIADTYTNNPISAQARGRLGDCYFALAANERSDSETVSNSFTMVTNSFTLVMQSRLADVTTRSIAEFRLGEALETMARLKSADNQNAAFKSVLKHFSNVLYEDNVKEGEQADMYWVEKAGMAAAALSEELGEWKQAKQFYQRLQTIVPPLQNVQSALDKKIARVQEHIGLDKN